MSISSKTAIELATATTEKNSKLSTIFREAKNIFDTNKSNTCDVFPLLNQDINYQQIIDDLNLNMRECDIVYLTHFYHAAYTIINISHYAMKEVISDIDKKRVIEVDACIQRLGLDRNLLLCDELKDNIEQVLRDL